MHLFENIWRIDDLCHCGTYGFVKHKREVYSDGKVFQQLSLTHQQPNAQ